MDIISQRSTNVICFKIRSNNIIPLLITNHLLPKTPSLELVQFRVVQLGDIQCDAFRGTKNLFKMTTTPIHTHITHQISMRCQARTSKYIKL